MGGARGDVEDLSIGPDIVNPFQDPKFKHLPSNLLSHLKYVYIYHTAPSIYL